MATINFTVEDHSIRVDNLIELAQGSNNFDTCAFSFDSTWDEFTLYAVMYQNPKNVFKLPLDEANTRKIPVEVLQKDGWVYIGARGEKEDTDETIATSMVVRLPVRKGAVNGNETGQEMLDQSQYEYLLGKVNELNEKCESLTKELENDFSQLSEEMEQLKQSETGTGSGTGWNSTQITLLETIGDYLLFSDQNTGQLLFDNLITSLRNGSSSGGSESDGDSSGDSGGGNTGGEEGVNIYNVTISAQNTTWDNTETDISEGDSYSVTFTPNTSYVIDSVTVTMGGVNITNTAYSNGTVTIGEVTGDIVIAIATSTTILYDLTEPMSFTDGTTTFDTGVKLFAESDMDWSIMYDITYDGNISSARFKEIVYCGTGSGADTMPFVLEYDNNTGKFITRMYAYENATTTGSSRKGVIVHKKGTQKKTEYDITNTGGLSIASNKVFAQVDAPIYLGGIPSDLGLSFYNHENAKCTFNAFKVFSKALSQEEALALLEV